MKFLGKFRPSDATPLTRFKMHVRMGKYQPYNWHPYERYYPAYLKDSDKFLYNTHYKLHYLAYHSPSNVQKRYRKLYKNFFVKHFGSYRASVRYLNNYSCHKWG